MTDQQNTKTQDHPPHSAHGLLSTLALSPIKAVIAIAIGAAAGAFVFTRTDEAATWASAALAMALAWSAMIDSDRYRLPDLLTLPMIAGALLYWAIVDPSQAPHHLIGAAAGYLSLVLVAELYRLLRKRDGLGRGDAKLMAAAGAWLGWKVLPFVVLGGSMGALLFIAALAMVQGRAALSRPIPFGPFIAGAFWILWVARPWPLG